MKPMDLSPYNKTVNSDCVADYDIGTISVDTSKGAVPIYLPPIGKSREEPNLTITKISNDPNRVALIAINGATIDGNHIFIFGSSGEPESVVLRNLDGHWSVVKTP